MVKVEIIATFNRTGQAIMLENKSRGIVPPSLWMVLKLLVTALFAKRQMARLGPLFVAQDRRGRDPIFGFAIGRTPMPDHIVREGEDLLDVDLARHIMARFPRQGKIDGGIDVDGGA